MPLFAFDKFWQSKFAFVECEFWPASPHHKLSVSYVSFQIEKEAQTWLDSDSDEEGEKKPEETRMEEAPASAESGEPQPGTSKDSEEMEGSPMPAEESEMEGLEGAVGGAVGGSD